jgi:hypothetical protein
MAAARTRTARQRLAIGRSAAGVPRTYRTKMHVHRAKVRIFLGEVATSCGGALNSMLVVLGDKFGLYKTGQYSSEMHEPLAPPATSERSTSGRVA